MTETTERAEVDVERRPTIPDYLLTLAGIIEAIPTSEALLLYRINQALEEVRKIAVGYHGLSAALIPDLVSLGDVYALSVAERLEEEAAADGGRVIQFPRRV